MTDLNRHEPLLTNLRTRGDKFDAGLDGVLRHLFGRIESLEQSGPLDARIVEAHATQSAKVDDQIALLNGHRKNLHSDLGTLTTRVGANATAIGIIRTDVLALDSRTKQNRLDALPPTTEQIKTLREIEKLRELREIEKLRELEALYRTFLNRAAPYLVVHGIQTGTDEEVARAAELRVELGIEGVSS